MSDGLPLGRAIGSFAIGDALGSPPFDVKQTVLWQYANSPTLMAIVSALTQAIDPTLDLDNFYDYVWNIGSAQGFGLDIWGRIVGVGRVFPIIEGSFFGWKEATDAVGWNQGIFWSGPGGTANFALSDDSYRRLILAKALANILDGSTASINRLLMTMFQHRGNAYVADNQNMSLTYTFTFSLTPVDLTIIQNSGVLPHPAGYIVHISHL